MSSRNQHRKSASLEKRPVGANSHFMPIYEYYCRDNHKIYQFYAKTLAQGRIVPKCPDGPGLRMEKLVSAFSVVGRTRKAPAEGPSSPDLADGEGGAGPDDARLNSAMEAMEGEMANLD